MSEMKERRDFHFSCLTLLVLRSVFLFESRSSCPDVDDFSDSDYKHDHSDDDRHQRELHRRFKFRFVFPFPDFRSFSLNSQASCLSRFLENSCLLLSFFVEITMLGSEDECVVCSFICAVITRTS